MHSMYVYMYRVYGSCIPNGNMLAWRLCLESAGEIGQLRRKIYSDGDLKDRNCERIPDGKEIVNLCMIYW